MSTVTWTAGNGDWSVGTDWSDGISPDDLVTGATIDVTSAATVTLGVTFGSS